MSIRLKTAFSELRTNPGRTMLVIFALVLGLWGVGSLLVSAAILQNDLRATFIGTKPPHAILTSTNFDRVDLAFFRNRPELQSAEFRDLSWQRIEAHPDEWIPVWLFGVEDFNNLSLARFHGEKGKKVPEPGTMLIERNGQLISDLAVGANARIRAGSKVREVPVSGVSFDPAQAPATQDHLIYAYVDKQTYTDITGEPSNQRLLLRLKDVKTRKDIQTAVNRLLADLESMGITVASVNIPKLDEHPHQWQLNTLLLLEGSITFLAFLMGAILVSQLMAAILARQIRQIGVLKAIGASRFPVFQIYLAMVLIVGVAATIIAIPLAVSSGSAFASFVSGKLNFDILTKRLPFRLYFLLVAAGLLMPILLSLPALLKGVRVSVNEALSDFGIRQDSPSNRKAAAGGPHLPAILVLAGRNTLRRKRRLMVTVFTMALGVAIFSAGFNVRQSLRNLLTDVRDGMRHDVQVVLRDQIPKDTALAPFRSLDNLNRIETWNGGKGELQNRVVSTDDGVGIVALPYDTDLFRIRVEKGRWLQGSGEPEVVMNQQALEGYGNPRVGDTLSLKVAGKKLAVKLVGIVWELDKPKIYMDQKQFDAFANPDHLVNSLMFVANDKTYDRVMVLKREIEKAIRPSDLNVLYVMSQAERVKVIYDHLNIILTTIISLALMVLVVSGLGMASATGINIMERTREIGVLRAIGATPEMIYQLFVAEGMIVSLASVLLGLLLSLPLSIAASPFFGSLMLGDGAMLRTAFSAHGFWVTLVATISFGWLASRIPARRAIRVSTREALAYE